MKTAWDFIVVGCGGLGSAATYWLSRMAGKEVLAIEQFHVGHDNGASQDHSRIIRLSYHAPEYTALTPHTYSAWQEVEEESGVQLVLRCGGLDLAPESSAALEDYASSMRVAGIPFESLSAREAMERWPQLTLDAGDRALYQPESGLVDARKAIQTHAALARAHGATILDNTPVRRIQPNGSGIEVHTDAGVFTAGNVVVTADAWTNQVLEGVGASYPLTVTQEQVTYWATPRLRDFAPDRFPIWIWHGGPGAYFYGFPVYGEVATKAGEDVGGQVVTPETRTFERDERAYDNLVRFLEATIPGFLGPVLYTKSCLYTMTPDRNFVIERLPEEPRIAVAVGAAHAFKFSCLIGQILADLATEGETRYPIAPFTSNRPAIKDPDFVPSLNLMAAH